MLRHTGLVELIRTPWRSYDTVRDFHLGQLSGAISSDGILVGAVYCEYRLNASFSNLTKTLVDAVLSAEDKRFFAHRGVDWIAVLRAAAKNVIAGRILQGGSTITQQLVRNVILRDSRRTFSRKALETFIALLVDHRFPKERILETYLNAAYFGHGIYGIRLASLYYLGKEVEDLTVGDSAYLAGMLKGPRHYCRCCNPIRASQRARYVLNRMTRNGYRLDKTDIKNPTRHFRRRKGLDSFCASTTPYFLDYVRQWLLQCSGGHFPHKSLIVRTSLSAGRQDVLEKVCRDVAQEGFAGKLACIVQDSATGFIRALAGGSDYRKQPFNVAINGRVQPGSTVKPFVLAAALENGFAVDKRYRSEPLEVVLPNQQVWNVRNYQKVYRGEISLAEALIYSDNSVFAQLILELGVRPVSRLLSKIGFETRQISPAAAIGAITEGVSPLQICSSYSTLSSGGVFINTSPVICLHKESGEMLFANTPLVRPAMRPGTAETIRSILRAVVTRGTGFLSLNSPEDEIKAKTGTTDEGSWYVSFDPSFRVLTWVESTEDDRAKDYPEKAVTARTLAQRIWNLLKSGSYGSPSLYGVFRGSDRLLVRDLLWVEEQFP